MMIVITDKNIILEGARNELDGSWDISIDEQFISPINYKSTSTYPNIYPRISDESPNIPEYNNKVRYLRTMNCLVEDNVNDILIQKQVDED